MTEALVGALQASLQGERIETHISWVLLAGDDAWKIKKPVRLGFLDFGTLEARHRMCEEELRLNRRLAGAIYLDVVPITGTATAPVLGGAGPAIEYALHMRRFPAGALLSERLAAGRLTGAEVDSLADRLAAFHAGAPVAGAGAATATGPESSPAAAYGTPQRIAADTDHLLDGLAARGADVASLRAWASEQGKALAAAFAERRADGFVREGHGDLHLANTLVLDGQVTAFDCIEFDPALRWIDTMADIAFVVMDFIAHERPGFAWRFLDRYLTAGGDYGGLAVLPYYLVYRAAVRALVAALRGGGPAAAGPDYLRLALRLAQRGRPRLLITCGLSGSGKSHAAALLLEAAGAVRVRADVERKRLFGVAPFASSRSAGAASSASSAGAVGTGIYTSEANERTYRRLADLAGVALRSGWPVIVDAAFLRQRERRAFAALARKLGVPFTILHCQADTPMLERRLRERSARGGDPSEADVAVLHRQRQYDEPLDAEERASAIALDAARPPEISDLLARWLARG